MKKKLLKSLSAVSLALGAVAMAVCPMLSDSAIQGAQAKMNALGGQFALDFNSNEEAKAAAADLNVRLSEEGDVLLKNDGTLPLSTGAKVSVFGVRQDSLTGGSGNIAGSLADAGFRINPTLKSVYDADSSAIGKEIYDFDKTVKGSFQIYNDAAVILLSRTGGEGSDPTRITTEDSSEGEHANQVTGKKHYLELTDSEEQLIENVEESGFKKIVVIINTSNAMEIGGLRDDDQINAILWIGRPGATGVKAVGEILSGVVNPSGRLVDEWAYDFTKDPTYFNFGNNDQVKETNIYYYSDGKPSGSTASSMSGGDGYHGIDYEEGIYLGYKYYETRAYEINKAGLDGDKWFNDNVAFPFGYGLSYTKFEYNSISLFKDADCEEALGTAVDASDLNSSVDNPAEIKEIYAKVEVENVGNFTGKQVVQIYVTAPYETNGTPKSYVTLVGFAKSDLLRPGQKQDVVVKVNVQDIASYNADLETNGHEKGYELDPGTYVVKAQDGSHKFDDAPYAEVTFDLAERAHLHLDDYSGNEIENLFSKENGLNYTTRDATVGVGAADPMTVLDRDEMGVLTDDFPSFPKKPTIASRTMTKDFEERIPFYEQFDADKTDVYGAYDTDLTKGEWAGKEIPDTWTQGLGVKDDNGLYPITIDQMSGVEWDDEKWDRFLNQLTFEEMRVFLLNGSYRTNPLDSVGKPVGADPDGPNNLSSTHSWCCECVISSTFNVELAEEEGIIVANLAIFAGKTGWYGPGMNTHRSPFGGRNNEYYSQDGLQGGIIAAAVCGGCESRGVTVYCKHMALNDQETNRNGENLFTWVPEQAIREIYMRQFQMAYQEGGASAGMSAFARIGQVPWCNSYNVCTRLLREQYGWHGWLVTDMYAGESKVAPMDLMVRAGHALPLGGLKEGANNYSIVTRYNYTQTDLTDPSTIKQDASKNTTQNADHGLSGSWNETGKYVEVGEEGHKVRCDAQWYAIRECAKQILYGTANSIVIKNGIRLNAYKGTQALTGVVQGSAVTGSAAVTDTLPEGSKVTYRVSSGNLPEGVTLNANTGAISGTPSLAGNYSFTVEANVSNLVKATKTFTLKVDSAFAVDNVEFESGEEVNAAITSQTISGAKFSVSEGNLPNGVILADNGVISGTPTEIGTFDVTVQATVKTGSGWNAKTVNYFVPVTFTVTGEPAPTEIEIINDKIDEIKGDIDEINTNIGELEDADSTINATINSSKTDLENKINSAKNDLIAKDAEIDAKIDELHAGCGGSIIATSAILSVIAVAGLGIALSKRKQD